ncbi:MAG: 50S ribosomal protein L11 methyltransferase [Pseudomonadales bacterium]|nr:50S ribosomal protein L11 methyltransferase [Pseudomonadales bacterium]
MTWLQLRIECNESQTNTIELILDLLGAVSITFEDGANQPLYEPPLGTNPLWQLTRITALFDGDTNQQQLVEQLTAQYSGSGPLNYQIQLMEDKTWQTEWMKHIKPVAFNNQLWVVPQGFDIPEPEATNVLFNPGLAFGTGSHPTTALCLEWLTRQNLNGKTLIDYGCGSGILGIAACLLGSKENHMVDIDSQAIEATTQNARLNNLSSKQIQCYLPETFPHVQRDVLIANILATPLIELAETFSTLLPSRGLLALSGILAEQVEAVQSAYETWFEVISIESKDEWILLNAVRK